MKSIIRKSAYLFIIITALLITCTPVRHTKKEKSDKLVEKAVRKTMRQLKRKGLIVKMHQRVLTKNKYP